MNNIKKHQNLLKKLGPRILLERIKSCLAHKKKPLPSDPSIVLYADVNDEEQLNHIVGAFQRQEYKGKLALYLFANNKELFTKEPLGTSITIMPAESRSVELFSEFDFCGCLSVEHYYGSNYLANMASASKDVVVTAIGKGSFYSSDNTGELSMMHSEDRVQLITSLQWDRSIVSLDYLRGLEEVPDAKARVQNVTCMSIDEMDFCENYKDNVCSQVDDIELNTEPRCTNKPLISVVVPLYRDKDYIIDCLLSLKNQTYKNLEVLIIDDCGEDGSVELVKSFIRDDFRFRLISHDKNRGLGGARNTGIENSSGSYISFLDADDQYSADALYLLHQEIERKDADMVIGKMAAKRGEILSPWEYIDKAITRLQQLHCENLRGIEPALAYMGSVTHRLYRRSLLVENQLYFIERCYWEDMPYSAEVWHYSKRISVIPNYIYYRTIREDENNPSITQIRNEKSFLDRDIILEYIIRRVCELEEDVEFQRLMLVLMKRMLGTTKNMLESIPEDSIISDFAKAWFVGHEEKSIRFQKELEERLEERLRGEA